MIYNMEYTNKEVSYIKGKASKFFKGNGRLLVCKEYNIKAGNSLISIGKSRFFDLIGRSIYNGEFYYATSLILSFNQNKNN